MKKVFICFLCCCFLMYDNSYSQIPKEFQGEYKAVLDYPFHEIAEQVHEALMELPYSSEGIRFYDSDLSVGNIRSSVESAPNFIRPSKIVFENENAVESMAKALRENSFQIIDIENNEIYDPDDMTLIINSNSIYKKNNNTGTISLVYKLKEDDSFNLIHKEESWYDKQQYYLLVLDYDELLYLSQNQISKLKPNYINLGYRDGNVYIMFYSGTAVYPYILHPIKDAM